MAHATSKQSAAACLQGLSLSTGWTVKGHVRRSKYATGGTFSQSYLVEKDGRKGFLKAFDFSDAFEAGEDTIAILNALTSAYEHERDVLQICKDRRLSRVVIAIEHGNVQVPNIAGMDGRVFYLIFEMADGDVRGQVAGSQRFDTLWSMRALKDVCLGLWQVHGQMIAHQDMKPSNVLVYAGEEAFRIADFGRSSRKGYRIWYDEFPVAGDKNYAPPELLYGFTHSEFANRRFGCDLYMLGNLAAFMFAGVNVTASLFARLDPQFHYSEWCGPYEQVIPYLRSAFTLVLEDLKEQLDPAVREDVVPLVSQLSNPDLSQRGDSKSIGRINQYSLERYVSRLDLLCKKLSVRLRSGETIV
jgi:eukaryotic-like serine/threonine-protein kinase